MLVPPRVKVPEPSVTLPPFPPPPANEPICVLKLLRFNVTPAVLASVTAELFPKAPLTLGTETTPAVSVPRVTVVGAGVGVGVGKSDGVG